MKKYIKWIPRILTIIYITFISIFALDVFGEGYKWWEMIIGFLMHMLPSFVLIIFLILAWKKPLIGGIIFLIIGLAFTIFFDGYQHLLGFLLICLPVFIIGILFILDHKNERG